MDLNRRGDFDGAPHVMRATARRIRKYAADDPELHRVMRELLDESEQFHRAMPEPMRNEHYAMSSHPLRSRVCEGKEMRSQRVDGTT